MFEQLVQIFSLSLLIIFICQFIPLTYSLRCSDDCVVVNAEFGEQNPFKHQCRTVKIDDHSTVCNAFLLIKYTDKTMDGALSIRHVQIDAPSTLHIQSKIYPRTLLTYISYHCSHTDNCNQDFLRETIGSDKWRQLNLTRLHEDLIALLYKEELTDNTTCDNHLICEREGLCYAELIQNKSISRPNQYTFDNKFPCKDTTEIQVNYDQLFSEIFDHSNTVTKVFCNKDKCNNEEIVRQAQKVIQENFRLPFNYSRYIPTNDAYRRNTFLLSSILFCILSIFNVLNI